MLQGLRSTHRPGRVHRGGASFSPGAPCREYALLRSRGARSGYSGVCIRRERVWCVFGSKLGRILQEATRGQLGLGWGDCRGFTVEEMERIDFEAVDLSEFTENLVDGSSAPSIALPEADETGNAMRARIRDFYDRNK